MIQSSIFSLEFNPETLNYPRSQNTVDATVVQFKWADQLFKHAVFAFLFYLVNQNFDGNSYFTFPTEN